MNHGKDICRQLKQLRRDIADQNGIELEIPECTYKGDCSGTCPRCDYELRYIEGELARRQRLGKAAVVAGTVLTLASVQTANAQEPVLMGKPAVIERDVEKTGVLKGVVTDKKTGEPLMACNVVVKQNGEIIGGARADFDGVYTIKGLAKGVYDVEFSYVGYEKVVLKSYEVKAEGFTVCNIALKRDPNAKIGVTPVTTPMPGLIAIDRMPSDSAGESDRTPVIEIGTPVLEIDTGDLPQDGGTGRYTIGGVETQLTGTPASESGQPKPCERPKPDGDDTNPLDKKAE